MKINTAKKHIINAHKKKITPMLWGAPGIGKSSIVKQAAKELNIDLVDLRLPQLDPPDLRGIPVPNRETKTCDWFYPEYLPTKGEGILFLDEIEKALVPVKNAALQLVLDRQVGSYVLPDGWSIVCAGNREDDGAFSTQLGSALANRMMHFQIEPDYHAWLAWAVENKINDTILGYLSFRQDHLYRYDPGANAFPTPRSWEMVNTMLKDVENITEQNELLEAVVGEAVGREYRAWLTVYKNVNVDDIILKGILPDFQKLESGREKSFIYAVTTAVSHRVKQRKDFSDIHENIAKFVTSLDAEMRAVFCKQISTKQLSALIEHKSFNAIARQLMNVIFGVA